MNHFSNSNKRKLNYIIHNPNTDEETAKALLTVFMQVNEKKVEGKLRELARLGLHPCLSLEYNNGICDMNY